MPRPRIVFMPGLLCDASVFAAQVAALAPHAEIRIADFSRHDSLAAMAEAALGLFEAGPVVLIGFSMGGRAALQAFRQAPERVAALCLMDTGAGPARADEAAARQPLVDLAEREGMCALAARWLPPMLHPDREADPALIGPLTAMVERASPAQHARQVRALLGRPDMRLLLPEIRCPVLVMVGRQDRWSPLAQHEEMAAAIPGARLAIIEESGHFAPVEQPDQVSAALADWLGLPRAGT